MKEMKEMIILADFFKVDVPEEEEDFSSKWITFKNWIITSCDYHHDYTIDEMIGILKFIIPVVVFHETFEKRNKQYNINCGKQLKDIELYLLKRKYEKLLEAGPYSEIDYNNKTEFYRDELKRIKETSAKNKEIK